MPHCVADGCKNNSRNNNTISYHRLPSEVHQDQRNSWLIAINRKKLPKHVYLCSNHFTEDWFNQSHDLQQKLLDETSKIKRILLPNAVPTIFKGSSEAEVNFILICQIWRDSFQMSSYRNSTDVSAYLFAGRLTSTSSPGLLKLSDDFDTAFRMNFHSKALSKSQESLRDPGDEVGAHLWEGEKTYRHIYKRLEEMISSGPNYDKNATSWLVFNSNTLESL